MSRADAIIWSRADAIKLAKLCRSLRDSKKTMIFQDQEWSAEHTTIRSPNIYPAGVLYLRLPSLFVSRKRKWWVCLTKFLKNLVGG